MYKYLKSIFIKKDVARLLSVVPSDKTRNNEHKLKHRRFCLHIRRNVFTVSVTEQWHRLPREVVECPSLEIFKQASGHCAGQL